MIRYSFLLCAGLLAAVCVACIPASSPPPVSPPPPSASAWPLAVCDAGSFANAVQTLKLPFDPSSTRNTPGGDPASPVPDNIKGDLQDAFNMAPAFFQSRLCGLNGVFIDPQGGDSWGFRNYNDGTEYIAISAGLWPDTKSSARPFHVYETSVLRRLLKNWAGGPQHPGNPNDPTDSAKTTVLAALAHEYGHILWYDTFVTTRGGPANFNNFCSDAIGNFYTGPNGSWAGPITDEPPVSRWLGWGHVSTTPHKSDDVQTQDLLDALPANPGKAAGLLNQIYHVRGPGRWPSLFAIFSPEEDFVETFKLFVLRKSTPSLQTLPTRIPGFSALRDIPGTCSLRPALQRKLACFAQAFCGDPLADPCGRTCTPLARR